MSTAIVDYSREGHIHSIDNVRFQNRVAIELFLFGPLRLKVRTFCLLRLLWPTANLFFYRQLTHSSSSYSAPIPSSASAAVTSDNRNIHLTTVQEYPQVAPLPLPDNVDPNETIQFSQERSRDINCHQMTLANDSSYIDVTCDNSADPHMASYDARGMVNLNCTMQSNVPEPFGGGYKFTHLNMPGGQWAQNGKFMAQDLQASHYTNLRQEVRSDWDKKGAFFGPFITTKRSYHSLLHANTNPMSRVLAVAYSTKPTEGDGQQKGQEAAEGVQQKPAVDSKKMRLKQAFKEYGSTIVVFHVGISLVSLGSFYALVSRYVSPFNSPVH